MKAPSAQVTGRPPGATPGLRAAAAAVPIATTIAHEGQVRACALALEAGGERLVLVTCDALTLPPRVICEATAAIVAATALPADRLLLCATHSHSLPCTIDFLGCQSDPAWCAAMGEAIVKAGIQALGRLAGPRADDLRVAMSFAETQEATIGRNSRILLKDGMIGWYGYQKSDMVRPTGPYDPDIPVLAFRRPDGALVSLVFAVSVHNIGTLTPGARSPAVLGLAAQELEHRHGGVGMFVPGAFGSSHNRTHETSGVPGPESVHRVVAAVEEGLAAAGPLAVTGIPSLRREFRYAVRVPDEEREAAAVSAYSRRYLGDAAAHYEAVFRAMRQELREQAGERGCWLQVFRLGEVAFVGVPGELFARLGLAIRRRSPFRHTYVLGLANGEIGYIPDRAAYDLGGYQLWAGWHSHLAPGTGEALVDQAVAMLEDLAALA